ncbi:uncharacterized protein K460DRAFT_42877 [Cucurbitaria berberidis CBS 394.84]|uniref:Uncharacterized protein n=1 Tax=Cucurbitaria berberidis CBS 394.84 TaxID=1168544 RepID=A0A9P4GSR5_9PLEO|nr:uncharacterized protein K460DRAFT_42877 [Cucurbitaria berberidis CBS 394.84]KAF1851863.1 hypothetical protein K460DRAFT_42877 [Cucurbitaria berberidis CBS 394.84]
MHRIQCCPVAWAIAGPSGVMTSYRGACAAQAVIAAVDQSDRAEDSDLSVASCATCQPTANGRVLEDESNPHPRGANRSTALATCRRSRKCRAREKAGHGACSRCWARAETFIAVYEWQTCLSRCTIHCPASRRWTAQHAGERQHSCVA